MAKGILYREMEATMVAIEEPTQQAVVETPESEGFVAINYITASLSIASGSSTCLRRGRARLTFCLAFAGCMCCDRSRRVMRIW